MNVLGSEMTSALAIAAVSAGIVMSFPAEVFDGFSPSDEPLHRKNEVVTSFVALDEKTEAAFLRKAKDTWRKGAKFSRLHADLVYADLPVSRSPAILTVESRQPPPAPPLAESGVLPFLPSRRAEAPRRLPMAENLESQTFSREELLRLD